MMEKEFKDILKSRRSIMVTMVLILIPMLDLAFNYRDYWEYLIHPDIYPKEWLMQSLSHPAYAGFLSASSRGHIPQMLFVWLLPCWMLLLYGDSYVREYHQGYHAVISTRCSAAKIFWGKNFTGFAVGFLAALISVGINFILSLILFRGGSSFAGLEDYIEQESRELQYAIAHPYLTYIGYLLCFCILVGLCSTFCVALSFCVKNHKLLYGLSFLLWFPQIMSKYSITYAIQPFLGLELHMIVPGVLIFCCMVGAALLVGYQKKVKYEEI